MMSEKDLLVSIQDKSSTLMLRDEDRFKIRLGGKGKLDYLAEGGKYQSINLKDIQNLYQSYSEFSGEDEFLRFGISFTHEKNEKGFVGRVTDIDIDSKGGLILEGRVKGKIKSIEGKIDTSDIVGKRFKRLHNNFVLKNQNIQIENSDIVIDSFSIHEVKKEVVDNDFGSSDSSEDLLVPSFRYQETQVSTNHAFRNKKRIQFPVVSFDEKIEGPGTSSLGIYANLIPFVSADYRLPKSMWEVMNPKKYGLDVSLGVDWGAGIKLKTGGENGGFESPRLTINGPGTSWINPNPPLTADLATGIQPYGRVDLQGASDEYTLGASQNISYSTQISPADVKISSNVPDVLIQTMDFDEITGLNLTAGVDPFVSFTVGFKTPQDLDWLIGKQNLASISAELSIPVEFEFDTPLFESGSTEVIAQTRAHYNANVSAFNMLGFDGIKRDIIDGDFFAWESGNLLNS